MLVAGKSELSSTDSLNKNEMVIESRFLVQLKLQTITSCYFQAYLVL